ncbi:hypothetical protein DPX39_060045900 [Trypanosoma brucei equiperdum]|uniref:Uncharacterized protein n=1 Tax=Trypanosoma brucei equiperdum TaxID=630700 RepID=A0A3L6L7N6_9TRYP|nr:hypothetical protein DPX39_060045900 [Trypanosoma brucei equiperdum]
MHQTFASFTSFLQSTTDQAKKLTYDGLEFVKKAQCIDIEEKCERLSGLFALPDSVVSNEENEAKTATSEGDLVKSVIPKELVANPPTDWEEAAEEWSRLTMFSLQCVSSCLISPSAILENEAVTERLCALLGVNSVKDLPIPPQAGFCWPSQELVRWVLSAKVVHEFRSSLVPRYISDEQYWVNISWRFQLYQMCCSALQLLDVMEAVATKPNVAGDVDADNTDTVSKNEDMNWQKLRHELTERYELAAWVEERCSAALAEVDLASANLHLLISLVQKGEVTDLGDSVLESCKYHKTKLSRLIGVAMAQPEKLLNSELCCEKGSLFARLVNMNKELGTVIESYTLLPKRDSSEMVRRATVDGDLAPCDANVLAQRQNSDDAVFEAALPWENDGEGEP